VTVTGLLPGAGGEGLLPCPDCLNPRASQNESPACGGCAGLPAVLPAGEGHGVSVFGSGANGDDRAEPVGVLVEVGATVDVVFGPRSSGVPEAAGLDVAVAVGLPVGAGVELGVEVAVAASEPGVRNIRAGAAPARRIMAAIDSTIIRRVPSLPRNHSDYDRPAPIVSGPAHASGGRCQEG